MGILSCIGHTPLISLDKWKQRIGFTGGLFGKWEGSNLTGSIKDRVALALIQKGEASGALIPHGTIIEATSGNLGISLSCLGCAMGYRVIIVMQGGMSEERASLIQHYGGELAFSPKEKGMAGAKELAKYLSHTIGGCYLPDQFTASVTRDIHREETARELLAQIHHIDCLVGGIGTAGTLCGIASLLKEKSPKTHIVGVEPSESPVLSRGVHGVHGIQGIGAGFVPPLFQRELVDEMVAVSTQDATEVARQFRRTEGLSVGISSGAVLCAVSSLAKKSIFSSKNTVVILPDRGDRYLSLKNF